MLSAALLLTIGVASVSAQTPPFKGALLIQPSLANDKCLTVASNTDGAIVSMQPCTGDASQKWTFSNGAIKAYGNKCLDVINGANVDGTLVQVWSCDTPNANQNWYYSVWDNSITWVNHAKCLDLTGGSTAAGNRPQVWGCNGASNANKVWNVGYLPTQLPATSQDTQFGTNTCGTTSSQTSNCQTAWINSAEDFCLWAPPTANSTIGDTEHEAVAWCTKSGRGTRTIPNGTLKGVHFVKTPDYVQITGVGDFTKMNIQKGDSGGELDNRGADGRGNPAGGLIYGNTFGSGAQYHEWTEFISDTEFCIRACTGGSATKLCNHVYDEMGCYWNIPANYDAGVFENCDADDDLPMGVYGTSTWKQGTSPTPAAHPAAASSNCAALPTISVTPAQKQSAKRRLSYVEAREDDFAALPRATPAPRSEF